MISQFAKDRTKDSSDIPNELIESSQQTLRDNVLQALDNYFADLGELQPVNLYELVLAEIEPPLLEALLRKVRGNQSKAAKILGLSRGTLRKKLKQYPLESMTK